jgi:hypothetical protein
MEATITVEAKVLGRKKALVPDWSVPLPPDFYRSGGRLTLRDLITSIVQEEVDAFNRRQKDRGLVQILTEEEIASGVEAGKVDSGGRDLEQEADPQTAIAAAIQAFEDGFYFVFLDGAKQDDLDREVYLSADSRLTFIRLVPLVGG